MLSTLWHNSSGVCWWQEMTTKCLWQEFLTLRHKTTEHHLIACNNKSVAYVSNNKRLCSTFCNIEAHYWQIQSIAQPLCDSRCYQHDAAGPQSHKLWHLLLVVSSGVCWWQETTTKCLWQEFLTLRHKTTEHHLIACNNKSVAYVSNNKRLCSTFCNIEAHYWQIQSIAQPLCDSRATCNQTWQVHITVHVRFGGLA